MHDDLFKVLALFVIIGLPVLLITLYSVSKMWIEHREKRMEIEARTTAEKAAQHVAQIERLEQRLQVLERIVTDDSHRLTQEFEALRIPSN
jgi:hypothetical protein